MPGGSYDSRLSVGGNSFWLQCFSPLALKVSRWDTWLRRLDECESAF